MSRVDRVNGGGRGSGDGERFDGAVLSEARSLREELGTVAPMPLPPLGRPRLLRWAPHLVVVGIALGTTLGNVDQMSERYHLGHPAGPAMALAQAVALLLALVRPVPAWWLSLAVSTAVAGMTTLPMGQGSQPWPWGPPALIAHATVTLLLALRLRPRAAWAACALGVGVPLLLQLTTSPGPGPSDTTVPLSAIVFGAVTLFGTLLRGRRETRTRLVEQETLTAEERARRTLLEERSRIARELHDVVAHHMSVISIQAQVAPHLVKDPPDELRENLEGIRENALEALTELRRVLGVLRAENPDAPEAAPQAPLPTLDRLDGLLDNARAAGLSVHRESTGEPRPLPPGVDLSAYRIVQEALSNAIRHAPGSTVRIELAYARGGLRVRVTDSGARSKAPPSPGAGHGLLGMRERAAMLGGDLATGPTPDGGYEVSAFLPANALPADSLPADSPPTDAPDREIRP
ncbi:sensor histidine kinase [Streptomyces sp. NPDC058308]|uniref:sensor histidine kinase n=1 Tax=Streptomyces sp. NPDC058308 TaxID=3346440 RepID=UPI0036E98687